MNDFVVKKSPKYIDYALIFLFSFVIVTVLFMYNLKEINTKLKSFNNYLITISKIEILENEFESLVNNKATFINYDNVVLKVNESYDLVSKLDAKKIKDDLTIDLTMEIELLNNQWNQKHDLIERFKSTNSAIIGSLNYIIELSKNIKTKYMLDNIHDVLILDDSLNTLYKLFTNIDLDKELVDKSSDNLIKILNKNENKDFDFLVKKYNSTINELLKLSIIKNDYFSINLKKNLSIIENKLHKEYEESIDYQQKIAFILFVISMILLLVSILAFVKSKKIKDELRAFKYAVENSDNSIVMTDVNRKIIYVNEAFEKVTGYKREEALGKEPNILKSGKLPSEFYEQMNVLLDKGQKWKGEFINLNKLGEIYYETASITPIINDKNQLTGYLAIKLDITNYVKQQQKVEFIAYHDNLTLLPNRRSLENNINNSIEKKISFALLFVDLDGFKIVNDTLGHDTGDLLLKEIAKRFKESLRKSDNVFRVGGDEFAIIIEYFNDEEVISLIAKKVIKNINEPILIDDNVLSVGCSIGIAKFPQDGLDLESLLKHSDIAMYKAKQDGKNRFVFFTNDLLSSVVIN